MKVLVLPFLLASIGLFSLSCQTMKDKDVDSMKDKAKESKTKMDAKAAYAECEKQRAIAIKNGGSPAACKK